VYPTAGGQNCQISVERLCSVRRPCRQGTFSVQTRSPLPVTACTHSNTTRSRYKWEKRKPCYRNGNRATQV